ncbi:hypothetical protein [Laceyella putida]|uniref:Uncharacterized protein n=1 Tax=Laceyella putida TaxID=110101 RepID=A0ABW2RKH7_9BACL
MSGNSLSMKDLTELINNVMGQQVLSEQQLTQIMRGAKKAHEQGGMAAVLEYLMKVTQADVDMEELKQFADSIRVNPNMGMDFLTGKKKIRRKKK